MLAIPLADLAVRMQRLACSPPPQPTIAHLHSIPLVVRKDSRYLSYFRKAGYPKISKSPSGPLPSTLPALNARRHPVRQCCRQRRSDLSRWFPQSQQRRLAHRHQVRGQYSASLPLAGSTTQLDCGLQCWPGCHALPKHLLHPGRSRA